MIGGLILGIVIGMIATMIIVCIAFEEDMDRYDQIDLDIDWKGDLKR